MDEVAGFGRQRGFRRGPERVVGRQQEGSQAFIAPVDGAWAGVGLDDRVKTIREAIGQTPLFLGDRSVEKEVEVACAEPPQTPGREVGRLLGHGETEDRDRIEPVRDGPAERGMLPAGREKVLVVGDK